MKKRAEPIERVSELLLRISQEAEGPNLSMDIGAWWAELVGLCGAYSSASRLRSGAQPPSTTTLPSPVLNVRVGSKPDERRHRQEGPDLGI